MFRVHFRLAVFVALDAFKDSEIAGYNVTFGAFTPLFVVRAGEDGKKSVVVGQKRRCPARHLVAVLANHRETARAVVHNECVFIIGAVTVVAPGPDAPEIGRGHAGVAGQAVEEQVAALYRKIGVFVNIFRVEYRPPRSRMTPLAVISQPGAVDVLVARAARRFDFRKILSDTKKLMDKLYNNLS